MPANEQSERPQRAVTRWRIIPGLFLGVIGVLAILSGIFMALFATFFNLRYGWIVPHPDTPARNQIAFTPMNITFWQLTFWCGAMALVASNAWFRGRWRLAWAATILFWIVAGLVQLVAPPRN